jgi:hypothetical protein
MFRTVFILDIVQKDFMVLGTIGCLILRNYIESLVQLPKEIQLAEKIDDMCWIEKHTPRWRHFSITFGQLLSSEFHIKHQVCLWLSLHLSHSSRNTILMAEHVVVYWDNVKECDCRPLRQPQGLIVEYPYYNHDIIGNGLSVLCCEEWPVITVFWMLKLLAGQFS